MPDLPTAVLERTEDGRPMVVLRDGALATLQGKLIAFPAGPITVWVGNEGVSPDGEEPIRDALWVRGRGERRHVLPSAVSPSVGRGSSEDWHLSLKPGIYEMSVSTGEPGPVATLLVRE